MTRAPLNLPDDFIQARMGLDEVARRYRLTTADIRGQGTKDAFATPIRRAITRWLSAQGRRWGPSAIAYLLGVHHTSVIDYRDQPVPPHVRDDQAQADQIVAAVFARHLSARYERAQRARQLALAIIERADDQALLDEVERILRVFPNSRKNA